VTSTQLTYGGLGIALAILALNLYGFWTVGKRDPKHLGPFAGAFCMGTLATLCIGGLLGWIAGTATAGTNTGGDRAVPGVTGQNGADIPAGTAGQLTPGGALLVFLLSVVFVVALKGAAKKATRRMIGGLICGICLAYTAAGAGLLDSTLTPLVNAAGDRLLGVFGGEA
jgi:hypothetical protein